MDDLYDVMLKRRSIRQYKDQPIPAALIAKLMQAAVNAPSGGNLQPLSIIIVRQPERRKALAKLVGNQPWVGQAPLSMVFCLDFYRLKRWAGMYETEFKGEQAVAHFLIGFADLMIAAQNVATLAQSHGLGSVYVGTILHDIDVARKQFDLPEFVLPMMVLAMGYPKSIPTEVSKLNSDIVFHEERYHLPEEKAIQRAFEEKYGAMADVGDKYLKKTFADVLAHQGEESQFLAEVKKEMQRLDIRNNAQFLFNYQYPSHVMRRMNAQLLQSFINAGFEMFAADPGGAVRSRVEVSGDGETAERFPLFPEIKP